MATMTVTTPATKTNSPRIRRVLWILSVCIAATTAVAWWWNLRLKSAAESKSNQVQWVRPETRNVVTDVNASGTVKLKTGAEVRVGAQLSGIVRRLSVSVGSHVRQGDVIAEIDSRTIVARIDQAKTQLAQAEVSLAKSQTDHDRTQKLFEAGIVPAQQSDDANATLEAM